MFLIFAVFSRKAKHYKLLSPSEQSSVFYSETQQTQKTQVRGVCVHRQDERGETSKRMLTILRFKFYLKLPGSNYYGMLVPVITSVDLRQCGGKTYNVST